ncbi:MAG: hypothetical protein HYY41_05890 [Chloroflexi bacterium]|nr:hypothetical protein [Chloroflexota bacterium]MBI2980335.1 hypothetical protein [Chloroflexota bacterium]
MMTSRRWLLTVGLAIGVLAIVAIVLVLTTGSPADKPLFPEDTPEGIIQRFILAIRDKDYLTAETYLAPPTDDRTKNDLRQFQISGRDEGPGWKAALGKSTIRDNEATVDVTVSVFRPGGPFENSVNTFQITFFLKKVGTAWKITSPLNLWWLY